MVKCPQCSSEILETDEKCLTCGYYAGPPNVRAVERDEERQALEERYLKAIETAHVNGSDENLMRFAEAVQTSQAVINLRLNALYHLVMADDALYANYSGAVEGESRSSAAWRADRHRRSVEGMLFGGYGKAIRYAALSLDGSGVNSYGPYAIKLREIAVRARTTVLEENSYDFVRRHCLVPGDAIPPGHAAVWANKHKLAVAKLAPQISGSTREDEFARILLFTEGKRETDNFLEAHIFGTFDANAIESVRGDSRGETKGERALLSDIKNHLRNKGKDWIEE